MRLLKAAGMTSKCDLFSVALNRIVIPAMAGIHSDLDPDGSVGMDSSMARRRIKEALDNSLELAVFPHSIC